jgi:UDP-N-acetylmuramoylalanine-D-glutamate ligase
VKTACLTGAASVGIPLGRNSRWLQEILETILRENGRQDVRLVMDGGACDLAIDLEGDGLPSHQGKRVRLCREEDCVPDPDEWQFSPETIVWRGASVRHGLMVVVQAGRAFVLSPLRELGIPEGVVEVALAAVAAAQALGVEPTGIRDGLLTWRKAFARLRPCGERLGVRAWDDSSCQDEYETLRALRCFDRKVTLVAGGPDFDPDFDPETVLAHANRIFLLPETPLAVRRMWETVLQAQTAKSAREAVRLGLDRTSAGGTLLVSPGSRTAENLSEILSQEMVR